MNYWRRGARDHGWPGDVPVVAEWWEPGVCPLCGGRGWHTAGGNDPAACGRCAAGAAWEGSLTTAIEALRGGDDG